MVIFFLETGARIRETMRLIWKDVDFERNLIIFCGKTWEARSVKILGADVYLIDYLVRERFS